jgi:uncharacterized membrane protein
MLAVLWHYFVALLVVIGAVVCGTVTARLAVTRLGSRLAAARTVAFAFGAGLLLVAGIGRIGWGIQSWSGESPAEVLDKWMFWVFSWLGTALLVVDYVIGRTRE